MKKILIADDEPQVLKMLTQLLEMEGFSVNTAPNGAEALKRFRETSPDLVILDIIMPEMEGIETIQQLKKIQSDLPIIAISGGGKTGPAGYLKLASRLGANHVFAKPVDRRDLLQAIRTLI